MLKQFKIIVPILMICLMFGGMTSTDVYAKAKWRIKVATLAPKSVGWAKNIRKIMHPAIKKATDGNVKLKWYWGGVMGDDKDYIDKMKIGQIDGAAFSGQGTVIACPEMAVLELPFLFRNYAEVDHIRDSMRNTFDKISAKNGYKLIIWSDQDFDQIYSIKYEMNKLTDFQNARIITWYGTLEQTVLETLGASPIPVGVPEIVSSMRQGIADTVIAPSIAVVGFQMYTIIKYVNPMNIRYSPACCFVRLDFWKKIPKSYQNKLDGVRNNEAVVFREKCREDSKKAYDAMIKYGMKESSLTGEQLNQIQRKCEAVWDALAGKLYSKALLKEVKDRLAEFRAKQGK
jgi:TRAP-type C4-dicarboxylate transport system substrate-binding protein